MTRTLFLLGTISLLILANSARAESLVHADPAHDQVPMRFACEDPSTDLIGTEWTDAGESFVVTMKMRQTIDPYALGYREYYFWVDVDPGAKKGYRPYAPDDLAWKDMYADYRFLLSFNTEPQGHDSRLWVQDCREVNCALPYSYTSSDGFRYQILGNTVTFTVSKSLLPEITNGTKFGYSFITYSYVNGCAVGDGSTNWGEEMFSGTGQ